MELAECYIMLPYLVVNTLSPNSDCVQFGSIVMEHLYLCTC
jgi:hypothetical protein